MTLQKSKSTKGYSSIQNTKQMSHKRWAYLFLKYYSAILNNLLTVLVKTCCISCLLTSITCEISISFLGAKVPDSKSCRARSREWKFLGATHTHTRLTALFPGLPGWAGTSKVKPISTLLKQEAVSGSGISWAICKSASRSRQITTPAPHHSNFLQAGYASCRPTSSVKALKARCSSFRSKKTIIPFVENLKYCRFV